MAKQMVMAHVAQIGSDELFSASGLIKVMRESVLPASIDSRQLIKAGHWRSMASLCVV
jgi:hypothetical protein